MDLESHWVEGVVGWDPSHTPYGARVCGTEAEIRELAHDDYDFVSAQLLPLGSPVVLRGSPEEIESQKQRHDGVSFVQWEQDETSALALGIEETWLLGLQGTQEAVFGEAALAALTDLLPDAPPKLGMHWSDGFQDLEIVVSGRAIIEVDGAEIDKVRHEIPWWDLSEGHSVKPLHYSLLQDWGEEVSEFVGPHALAAGAALASLLGCAFRNPALRLPEPSPKVTSLFSRGSEFDGSEVSFPR